MKGSGRMDRQTAGLTHRFPPAFCRTLSPLRPLPCLLQNDYVRKCHTFLWLIPFFPWALWPNDVVSFCFCPTENVSLKSCAQQRWSIYVQSSLVKRGYFTWRADDHEKLNRKQKLYRFKQVKWLKKSGKNIANFWLLTFFSFLQVSESFCEFRFLLFFFKSKVLTFLCFSRKAKKSANFWW